LQAWTESPQQKLAVQTERNLAIYRSLTANGMEIPFPQRDIRIVGETKIPPSGLNND
jgi:small-conductance mechanosensitive channel